MVDIQRSSFYDGPGIRTIVFLKGCLLSCPWCCNPESILPYPQVYFEDKNHQKIKGVYGKIIKIKDLIKIIKKDIAFYKKSGGGVTFSGGEPLLQGMNLLECLKQLKKAGIHTCVETSLFCPSNYLNLIMEYVDLFIIDIKILNSEDCKRYLKGNLKIYLQNIKKVLKNHKNNVFRFPVVKPYTFNPNNIKKLHYFLKEWKIKKLEIFSIHNFATRKYNSLGKSGPYFEIVKKEELKSLKESFLKLKIDVKILNI
ncbi:MAG: radical SAM protein [Atribacterota bacterium]|nr:radical SAM protein [Atribacterota bacterium]